MDGQESDLEATEKRKEKPELGTAAGSSTGSAPPPHTQYRFQKSPVNRQNCPRGLEAFRLPQFPLSHPDKSSCFLVPSLPKALDTFLLAQHLNLPDCSVQGPIAALFVASTASSTLLSPPAQRWGLRALQMSFIDAFWH